MTEDLSPYMLPGPALFSESQILHKSLSEKNFSWAEILHGKNWFSATGRVTNAVVYSYSCVPQKF